MQKITRAQAKFSGNYSRLFFTIPRITRGIREITRAYFLQYKKLLALTHAGQKNYSRFAASHEAQQEAAIPKVDKV